MKRFSNFFNSSMSANQTTGMACSFCANIVALMTMAISAIVIFLLSLIRIIINAVVIIKSEYGWLNLQRA